MCEEIRVPDVAVFRVTHPKEIQAPQGGGGPVRSRASLAPNCPIGKLQGLNLAASARSARTFDFKGGGDKLERGPASFPKDEERQIT